MHERRNRQQIAFSVYAHYGTVNLVQSEMENHRSWFAVRGPLRPENDLRSGEFEGPCRRRTLACQCVSVFHPMHAAKRGTRDFVVAACAYCTHNAVPAPALSQPIN